MLTSLRCNPSVIIGAILLIMFYTEMSASVLGKKIKVIPRSKIFWITTGVIFAVWCILRNFIAFLQP